MKPKKIRAALKARQARFDRSKERQGRKRPGSTNRKKAGRA